MHISPLLHSQHRKLVFAQDEEEDKILILLAIATFILILFIICISMCRTSHPKAIYIENVPENCRVFTLNGIEVWNDTEVINIR